MKVLSLFDGIAGARQALEQLNCTPDLYYASEINPRAIEIAKSKWFSITQIGDIRNLTPYQIKKLKKVGFDLVIFGSPCTDLSVARKNRESLDGKHSGLFYLAAKILKAIKPKFFLMENVSSMSVESRDEITKILGVGCIEVNSRVFTGQHRSRLYWFNWLAPHIPTVPIAFRDRLLPIEGLFQTEARSLSLSRAGKAYMLRKTKDGRDHWDFGHYSDTDRPFSACIVANFKKGVPYNVLLDRRGNQNENIPWPWMRRFHPVECERLQGFPDGYTQGIPWTPRYELIGNAFTVPVISHLLRPIAYKV